ncbi:ATP-binding cassette domain-containing protein [Trueperella pyogenes]|uniref:ATP-binding cassette domain-containing protein n=1 Tax=Trueperella pyogenes TaxID=1661 RepID=UPI003DA9947F
MLEVRDLSISFAGTTVVDRVSFSVAPGERVCLIGESGSGKSLTALAIDGLLPASAQVTGSILFRGAQIVGAGEAQLQNIRGEQIGFVFQEPHTALNPVLRIEKQIVAALAQHRRLRRKDRVPLPGSWHAASACQNPSWSVFLISSLAGSANAW